MRRQALICGRRGGAPYHPFGPIEVAVVSIFVDDYSVTVADTEGRPPTLEGIDLVVGLDDRWTEALERTWLDPMESWLCEGGRLLFVHNGICWSRDDRWWELTGGRFTGHEAARKLTFTRLSDRASFELFEEPYRFALHPSAGVRVLAEYEDEGCSWPAMWSRQVGKGSIAFALQIGRAHV